MVYERKRVAGIVGFVSHGQSMKGNKSIHAILTMLNAHNIKVAIKIIEITK